MKITRYKKAQKVLSFYESNFGFREPYQVVVDGTFTLAALKMRISIREQLPKYLAAECNLTTTSCCLQETKNLGPDLHAAYCILQQFCLIPCGHEEKALPASACLDTMTRKGNSEKLFVVTQDQQLQETLRKRPFVPVMYLHHQALTLQKPSEIAIEASKSVQRQKVIPVGYQKDVLDTLKRNIFGEIPEIHARKRKRKIKQPNPLSCKKSKKKSGAVESKKVAETGDEKKNRRKHKRLKMSDELKRIHEKLLTTEGQH